MKEKSKHSKPEQAISRKPYQEYEASELLIAALNAIRKELGRVYWNNNQQEIQDPFDNTGGEYKNDVFEVYAYSWDEEAEQPYNFRWLGHNFDVSWYKYLGRITLTNRKIISDEINQMLEDCLSSIRKEEKN
jgi:hypothetical protein